MKSFLLLLFTAVAVQLSAQSDYDPRLLAKFSEERIAYLQKERPAVIDYWTYYLDNSFSIVDGQASGKVIATDKEIIVSDTKNFNILSLNLVMNRDKSQSFKIKGDNKYLVLLSNRQLVNGFNNQNRKN